MQCYGGGGSFNKFLVEKFVACFCLANVSATGADAERCRERRTDGMATGDGVEVPSARSFASKSVSVDRWAGTRD